MKRLLICSRSHVPEGGADRIIADLCRHLPGHGWDVQLGLTQGARFNDVQRYREALGEDLPTIAIDGRLGTRSARIEALRDVIRRTRPDVVLSMRVFDAYEAVLLEKLASASGPRLAVGIRSFETPYLADLASYRDAVDLCVTSGELLADLAVETCKLQRHRVVSIGGGVHAPTQAIKAREPAKTLRLLYAGRLDEGQKRVNDLPPLLDALERRGVRFQLDIAGSGPAEAALRAALATRIQRGQVVLHGWVSRDALYRDHYPLADVFLHVAGWEGMTIAPREAMAHGVVPVISRFLGLRREGQFVDGVNALTFPVADIEAAAACVQRLQQETGLLARLSSAAMHSQSGAYTFEGALHAWAAALDGSLAGRPALCPVPEFGDRSSGRLGQLGLSGPWQSRLRRWLRRPVQHLSPGSEWPTASGGMTAQQRDLFEAEARRLDDTRATPASAIGAHG